MSCQVPLSAKTNNPGDGVRPDPALQSRAKSRLCFGLGWSLKEAPGPSPGVWLAFLLSLGEVKHEITGCSASIIVIELFCVALCSILLTDLSLFPHLFIFLIVYPDRKLKHKDRTEPKWDSPQALAHHQSRWRQCHWSGWASEQSS